VELTGKPVRITRTTIGRSSRPAATPSFISATIGNRCEPTSEELATWPPRLQNSGSSRIPLPHRQRLQFSEWRMLGIRQIHLVLGFRCQSFRRDLHQVQLSERIHCRRSLCLRKCGSSRLQVQPRRVAGLSQRRQILPPRALRSSSSAAKAVCQASPTLPGSRWIGPTPRSRSESAAASPMQTAEFLPARSASPPSREHASVFHCSPPALPDRLDAAHTGDRGYSGR
jgi:hypothetical protein